jgi:hypothetical protein
MNIYGVTYPGNVNERKYKTLHALPRGTAGTVTVV